MRGVRIRLLSGFEVTHDGRRLMLQPACQRLIAMVALSRRGVRREAAACRLWPDTAEARAKANLRSTLWRLGKCDVAIVDARDGQLILAESVWVDARDGVEALANGQVDHYLHDLHASLPFQDIEGGLLPNWYDEWLDNERERLRQLVMDVLERRASRAMDRGDYGEAIQCGLGAVSIEPLRESARRVVIAAHLAQGNEIEARREHQRYQRSVQALQGLQPAGRISGLLTDALSSPDHLATR